MHAGHSGRLVGLVIQAGYLGWSLRKQQAGYSVWTNKEGFKIIINYSSSRNIQILITPCLNCK